MTHAGPPGFVHWLGRYADACSLDGAALARERTVLVHGVVCTFVCPAMGRDDVAVVLIDAGGIESAADDALLQDALARNLENFLLGAPLFLFNADSRRLVMGQRFEYAGIEPSAFRAILDAMAQQALAWHRRPAQG